jgi:folate-dependent phosphoribosylglycinamide formyltransferase PurN
MNLIANFRVELSVLAGYMLIVGPEMCQQYTMINLHPAEPGGPKGTWREVIWKLIETRAENTGVMMHLATPELDEGPPVTFCRFSIRGEPFDDYWLRLQSKTNNATNEQNNDETELFDLIRQHGLKREFPLIVRTVKAFSESRVKVENGKIVDNDGNIIDGYDLSTEINMIVNEKAA